MEAPGHLKITIQNLPGAPTFDLAGAVAIVAVMIPIQQDIGESFNEIFEKIPFYAETITTINTGRQIDYSS